MVSQYGEPGDRPVLVVPSYDRPLVPRCPERVERFRQNLEAALAEARSGKIGATVSTGRSADHEPSLTVINACVTCRGACCEHGGDEAYLDAKFFALKLLTDPKHANGAMIAEYIGSIPSESIQGSCIFHGEHGCVLARDVRSATCNEFLCYPLHEHLQSGEDLECGSVVVAKDGSDFQRVGWMEHDGSRTETDVR